jgi:hypothetical protein
MAHCHVFGEKVESAEEPRQTEDEIDFPSSTKRPKGEAIKPGFFHWARDTYDLLERVLGIGSPG